MNTDDICPKVRHYIKIAQRRINAKVERGTEAADYPIQDEIAKSRVARHQNSHAAYEFLNHTKTRISSFAYPPLEVVGMTIGYE